MIKRSKLPRFPQNTDADGNGIVDREELSSLIKKLGIPLKDPVMDTDFVFGLMLNFLIAVHRLTLNFWQIHLTPTKITSAVFKNFPSFLNLS